MTRKAIRPQTSRHVMIYDEDWQYLDELYGRHLGPNAVGTGSAIRELVHKFCRNLRAKSEQVMDQGASP